MDTVGTVVTLHIYDVGPRARALNEVFRAMGTGAFHAAVEVFGQEYSFRATDTRGTGVFSCRPRGNADHVYRESLCMGTTPVTEKELKDAIKELSGRWQGRGYDLLRHNCCHFSEELCVKLGVGHIPTWVNNLAHAGSELEIDSRLESLIATFQKVKETANISARYLREVDDHLGFTQTFSMSAGYNSRKIQEALSRAKAILPMPFVGMPVVASSML